MWSVASGIIISQLGEEVRDQSDEEVAEDEEGEEKRELYVPPKVVAMPYGEYIGGLHLVLSSAVVWCRGGGGGW